MYLLLTLACKKDESSLSTCGPISPNTSETALEFSAPPHHLLAISIDTLRRDHVGYYHTGADTPFLTNLLSESVVLEDFRACANWTLPGMVCAMTGQSTLDLGLEPLTPDKNADPDFLDPNMETLATWLVAAGWQTTLVTSSKLFSHYRSEANGFQQEVFDDDAPADWVVDQAIDQLQQTQSTENWYLHLHFRDPHAPYNPPIAYQGDLAGVDLSPYDPRTADGVLAIISGLQKPSGPSIKELQPILNTLYTGEVKFLDDQLTRLWQMLNDSGYLEDTLVVLWSDHGEQLLEHEKFQHGQSLHAEEGMIVGAFWAKNLAPLQVEEPYHHPDLAPTLLNALGVDIPDSIMGTIIGQAPKDRVRISSAVDATGLPIHAVERNGLRLLYNWDGNSELYDYKTDPSELNDITRANKDNVQCLWDFLKPELASVDQSLAGPPIDPN